MPRLLTFLSLFILLTFSCNLNENPAHVEKQESESPDKHIPNEWFYMQRSFPNGVNKKIQIDALKQVTSMKEEAKQRNAEPWSFVGPTNVGGRITDIEMPLSDINTVYAGTASGGIFKSTDQGDNWFPIFDDALSLAIGDMAISESNEDLIYVGTGEPNGGGGSIAYDGYGVYKSEDAGENWTHIGLEEVGSIGKVIIDPTDNDKVFVAAMGDLFGNSPERGIYRTIDGGSSWDQVLTLTDSTGGIDMVIHPEDPNIILAAMWERLRRPSYRDYAGESSGIYKSVDGGDTWSKITVDLPTGQIGRIGLTISSSPPYQVWALVGGDDFRYIGIYKSPDLGESWEDLGLNGIDRNETSYWFNKIFVDPTNPEKLFTACLDMFQSTDGGDSWFYSSDNMHVDQHTIFIHPLNPDLVFAGNDGGVYRSFDGGFGWDKKNTLPITQFYTTAIDPTNNDRMYGGTQDNGTVRTTAGVDDWQRILGGDGFVVQINPNNGANLYYEWQFGNLYRSENLANTDNYIKPTDLENFNWNTPHLIDPNNDNIIYAGGESLWKSTDRGDNWQIIGRDFTNSGGGNLAFGTITSIDISPLNSNVIYVGMDDGNIWGTRNGGLSWTDLEAQIPDRWVTKIHADPNNEEVVYVSISGYRYNEYIGHIFKSTDHGANWTDISQQLPELPVNDFIVDPLVEGQIFVATDIAVFMTEDEGQNWTILGEDLPNVPVTDIDFDANTGWLTAATYGRSMYRININRNLGVYTNNVAEAVKDLVLFPNPVNDIARLKFDISNDSSLSFTITNLNGQVLREWNSNNLIAGLNDISINVSDFIPGIYNLKLASKKGISSIQFAKE